MLYPLWLIAHSRCRLRMTGQSYMCGNLPLIGLSEPCLPRVYRLYPFRSSPRYTRQTRPLSASFMNSSGSSLHGVYSPSHRRTHTMGAPQSGHMFHAARRLCLSHGRSGSRAIGIFILTLPSELRHERVIRLYCK